MAHICFVTEELYPVTSGGAGALIYNSLCVLKQRGHTVSVLLDVSTGIFKQAVQTFSSTSSEVTFDGLHLVDQLAQDLPPYSDTSLGGWYYWRSYRLFWALRKVTQQAEVDFVEFNDFYGPAYYSLAAKACGLAFDKTLLGVRLHTPWELLLMAGDSLPVAPYVLTIRYLERASLRLAEHVLAPSEDYIRNVYLSLYGKGLGDIHSSKPALLKWPQEVSATGHKKDIVLFYGRLQPVKGLDRFLAAGLELVQRIPELEFWFVGADSIFGRDSGSNSYREFLQRRIPDHLKNKFRFTGRLSFDELGRVLPRVRFAVFPNYLESFCYAAHELYQARVPVITSDLPAFTSHFAHHENALLFDGTISDLVNQMEQLHHDEHLRARLTRPYLTNENPLGTFYDSLPTESWMSARSQFGEESGILIVVIDDGEGDLDATLSSFRSDLLVVDCVVILKQLETARAVTPIVIFDRSYTWQSTGGKPLAPDAVKTRDALLMLTAGDRLQPGALRRWRSILTDHPQISFVGSWRQLRQPDGQVSIDRVSIEVCLDQLLFMARPLRQRVLMRTDPGRRLDDVFDLRLGPLGELGYLWRLDQVHGPGLSVPEVLVDCRAEPQLAPSQAFPSIVSYLVAQDSSATRLKSLALRSLITQTSKPSGLRRIAAEVNAIKTSKGRHLIVQYSRVRQRVRAFMSR